MSLPASVPGAQAPIGLYDSGVGGLSVWQAVHNELPHEDLIYVADTAYVPYGEKSRHTVVARAEALGRYFREQGVKAIVVPCNTATAAAIALLREWHPDIPVIGIEPAVKPAARLSHSGHIGVLATTGTLASPRFRQLVAREAGQARAWLQPCPEWVMAVERGDLSTLETHELVRRTLAPMLAAQVDVLVLGCTHFPFLLAAIRDVVGPDFPVLETGVAVARQLRRQLAASDRLRSEACGHSPHHRFLTSGQAEPMEEAIQRLLRQTASATRLPADYC